MDGFCAFGRFSCINECVCVCVCVCACVCVHVLVHACACVCMHSGAEIGTWLISTFSKREIVTVRLASADSGEADTDKQTLPPSTGSCVGSLTDLFTVPYACPCQSLSPDGDTDTLVFNDSCWSECQKDTQRSRFPSENTLVHNCFSPADIRNTSILYFHV